LKSTYIKRKSEIILLPIESDNDAAKHIIEDGDEIFVPEFTVTISGEVEKPGLYALIPNKTNNLNSLLRTAGGVKRTADLSKVKVIHSSDGNISIVDCRKPEMQSRIQLMSGDTVFVAKTYYQAQIRKITLGLLAIILIL